LKLHPMHPKQTGSLRGWPLIMVKVGYGAGPIDVSKEE